MPTPRDSYSVLRDRLRWRVALLLAMLIALLMIALGLLNNSLGFHDTALLAWGILGLACGLLVTLALLPRALGANVFFATIALALVAVLALGLHLGRSMLHWAYVFPPVVAFVLRPAWALLAMMAFGVYASLIGLRMLEPIDVTRFASGYGLLVCFTYTYALLQERAAAMLRYQSDHDVLSGCLNRRTFNEAIAALDLSATRCTFLLIDLDHFKQINDERGHLVGDRVITAVADRLREALAADDRLYRYGGEEFALMLAGQDELRGVALAERLRQAVAAAEVSGVRLTVSVGVACWTARAGNVTEAIRDADRALYAAKHAGRNRVVAASTLGPDPGEAL